MKLDWFAQSRLNLAISHVLEGGVIQLILALAFFITLPKFPAFYYFALGGFGVCMYYYGGKRYEYVAEAKAAGSSNFTMRYRGWWIGDWGIDKIRDFLFPAVSSSLITVAGFFFT